MEDAHTQTQTQAVYLRTSRRVQSIKRKFNYACVRRSVIFFLLSLFRCCCIRRFGRSSVQCRMEFCLEIVGNICFHFRRCHFIFGLIVHCFCSLHRRYIQLKRKQNTIDYTSISIDEKWANRHTHTLAHTHIRRHACVVGFADVVCEYACSHMGVWLSLSLLQSWFGMRARPTLAHKVKFEISFSTPIIQ